MKQQDRSAQTRQSILDAAERVIDREGAFALTTGKISREAGVSIGSVYNYFRDVEDILTTLGYRIVKDAS